MRLRAHFVSDQGDATRKRTLQFVQHSARPGADVAHGSDRDFRMGVQHLQNLSRLERRVFHMPGPAGAVQVGAVRVAWRDAGFSRLLGDEHILYDCFGPVAPWISS